MRENSVKTGSYGISGATLKIIAVVSMLIDHTAATIVERYMYHNEIYWGSDDPVYFLYRIMRGIGRLAFPIYCYLLAEGLKYTRSRIKYALRLGAFALISEVPFDMAFQKSFFDFSYNSVFVTLLIAFLAIWGIDTVASKAANHAGTDIPAQTDITAETDIPVQTDIPAETANPASDEISRPKRDIKAILLSIAIFLIAAFAAELLNTDYGAGGVLAVLLLYLFRKNRALSMAIAVISLALTCGFTEAIALVDVPLLLIYNGTRGRQMKYFFYAFYPAHLFILSMICYFLGYGI